MPRFYRNSRALLRIFFLLVIAAGLFGRWYATHHWQPDLSALELPSLTEEADWVDLVATLLESGIQLFQALTGG